MANKLRVAALTRRALERSDSRKGRGYGERFMDARARGLILCKDGKERTVEDWLLYLPPNLASGVRKLMEQDGKDLSE